MVDGYRVLFLMSISTAENLVDDISLVCHQEQSLGVLIQTSHRVDSLRIIQEFHDILRMVLVRCRADDPARFIYDQKYRFFLLTNHLPVTDYLLPRMDLHSHHGDFAVHKHLSILNEPVRLSPRADARVTQILI